MWRTMAYSVAFCALLEVGLLGIFWVTDGGFVGFLAGLVFLLALLAFSPE